MKYISFCLSEQLELFMMCYCLGIFFGDSNENGCPFPLSLLFSTCFYRSSRLHTKRNELVWR